MLEPFDLTSATLRLLGRPGTFRIEGNPHTFPGRFSVVDVETGWYELVNRADVESASPAAVAWIAGFLSASAPGLEVFFGDRGVIDEQRGWWEDLVAEFERTGNTPTLNAFPVELLPVELEPFREQLWTSVGYDIVRWRDGWRFTDDSYGDLVAGTPCERDGHEGEQLDDRWDFYCPRCHYVTMSQS